MNETPPRFLQVIVVGTDGSEGAQRAVDWSARLARSTGARVHAVNVLTYNQELFRDITPDTMTTWRRQLRHDLETDWVAPLVEHDATFRCVVVEDESPALGLIHAADREQGDLIVVGATGHRSFAGRVLGSTSYTLTHHARRPVIVVPPTWRQPTAG